ncbi:MAG: hypothetical protein H6740_06060 [Alphaproteobacteria bacterium]|nr:hypothetical protein [Alphaproteobacteria bacterium]
MRLFPILLVSVALWGCRAKDEPVDSGVEVPDDSGPVEEVDADGDGVPSTEDCDDQDRSVYPGNTETPYNGVDDDCDEGTPDDDLDGDGFVAAEDCDDGDAAVNPGATEACNGVDDDCNGEVDDAAGDTWYADVDGDGYGDPDAPEQSCEGDAGTVADSSDCDDLRADANPGAAEVCDEIDNNCDGAVDEGVTTTWYQDADGDGHGTADVTAEACAQPAGYASGDADCDDTDASVSPNGTELCNGVDDDCDGDTDEEAADAATWYGDADGDGYGDPSAASEACEAPSGAVSDDSDCDDGDGAVNPGATELCNGVDDDCDGDTDEDDAADATTWYLDFDEDGYGGSRYSLTRCAQPSGYVSDSTDCDDGDAASNPGAAELCDGADNDCDGTVDDSAEVYGDAEACAATDCLDLLNTRSSAADGTYWIDPDGAGAFEALCDMSTDGGGWTLVGSFNNNDGTYNWTRYSSDADNLDNWTNEDTFGSLGAYQSADYKSPAFWRMTGATDLLAMDDGGGWASYDGAVSGNLRDTVSAYSACQTSFLSGLSVDSSDSTVVSYGQLTYYGGDPNNGSRCAFNYQVNSTDSSVIGMAHQGCGTAGFGHLGWYSSANGTHYDRDHYFCLQATLSLNTSTSCGAWYGSTAVHWFTETACSYALLLVR